MITLEHANYNLVIDISMKLCSMDILSMKLCCIQHAYKIGEFVVTQQGHDTSASGVRGPCYIAPENPCAILQDLQLSHIFTKSSFHAISNLDANRVIARTNAFSMKSEDNCLALKIIMLEKNNSLTIHFVVKISLKNVQVVKKQADIKPRHTYRDITELHAKIMLLLTRLTVSPENNQQSGNIRGCGMILIWIHTINFLNF